MKTVPRATLLAIEGEDHGRRFEIAPPTAMIGRGVHNSIRLNDSEVSRQHAIIEFDAERRMFRISDRGSSNGTWVNGEPIHAHFLQNGDRIQIGRTVLTYSPSDDREEATQIARHVELLPTAENDRSQIVGSFAQEEFHPGSEKSESGSSLLVNLHLLYRITEESINPALTLDELLKRILSLTIEAVGADRGCVLLRNPGGQMQAIAYTGNESGSASPMPVSTTIVDYVLQNRQAVRTSDALHDSRFATGQSIVKAGVREAICVPMPGQSELVGAIYIDTTTSAGGSSVAHVQPASKFTEDHLKLVMSIGRQAALSIESKQFEQALLKSERLAATGQTIAMISHHVKNILQGVRGGSFLVDQGLAKEDVGMIRKGWEIVERNQLRINTVIMDMLSFSKERIPALAPCSITALVAEIYDDLKPRADTEGIRFDAEYDATIPISGFDREALHAAILNVIINAFDAVEQSEEPRVLIQTQFDAANSRLMVVVSDNGPGIPMENFELIFAPFESDKGARGTGLGLPVSRKNLREHGGDIRVESRVGQGTRFILHWPKLDADAGDAEFNDGETMV